MSDVQIGDRVGAISHDDGETVHLFGYGVYDGDFVPDGAAGPMAQVLRRGKQANPRITLDNGKTVWGCECWWGPEADVKQVLEGRTVSDTDIDASRVEAYSEELEIAQDRELVEVMQTIEGEYPELEEIQEALKDALCHCVSLPDAIAVPETTVTLLEAVGALVVGGLVLKLTSLSIETGAEGKEIEASLALALTSGKALSLSLVLKAAPRKAE